MNAYTETFSDEIEKGTLNGIVTPQMLTKLFKLSMISPFKANVETMN